MGGRVNRVEVAHTQSVVHEAFWIDNGDIRVADCKGEASVLAIAFGIARIATSACGAGDDERIMEELYVTCKHLALIVVIWERCVYLVEHYGCSALERRNTPRTCAGLRRYHGR